MLFSYIVTCNITTNNLLLGHKKRKNAWGGGAKQNRPEKFYCLTMLERFGMDCQNFCILAEKPTGKIVLVDKK